MPKTSSSRWLAGIAVSVALLALASVIVTLASSGDVELLPEGTPEGTVQRYLLAVDEREFEAAYALLGAEYHQDCSPDDFRGSRFFGLDDNVRIRLNSVEEMSDGTEVSVTITQFRGSPPFEVSESTFDQHYFLRETAEGWRIDSAPWPFLGCPLKVAPELREPPVQAPKPSASEAPDAGTGA